MKKRFIISVISIIMFTGIVNAQSAGQKDGEAYIVDPGTKSNQLVLQLANISKTTAAENISVKLIKTSKQLTFKKNEQLLSGITQNKTHDVKFPFDINITAPSNKKDTVEFLITGKGISLTKAFVLKYSAPKEFALYQNYPNPFNPSTTIRYSVPEVGAVGVSLKIYNILGQEVTTLINEEKTAGNYEVKFDARNFASGIYIYRLTAGHFSSIKKMMVMK